MAKSKWLVSGTDYEDEYGNKYGTTTEQLAAQKWLQENPSSKGLESNIYNKEGGYGSLDIEAAYENGGFNKWITTTSSPTPPDDPPPAPPPGGDGASASAPAPSYSTDRNTIAPIGNYDPATNEAYQNALALLEAERGKVPTYNNSYADELDSLMQEISGRGRFNYDLDSDPLYQQYRDQYMQQGQQAMMHTMGQAAALTGGYGSTYSQAVGQQQYNAYLQNLNDIVPDLYQNAYGRWRDEGTDLYNRYSLTQQAASDEYNKYRDAMGDYWNNVDYAWQNAQTEYNRGVDQWGREYQLNKDAIATQQDDYSRLMELMSVGYTPTAEELADAGMSEAEFAAWDNYIKSQNAGGGGGGGNDAQSVVPTGSYEELSPAAQQFYDTFIGEKSSYSGSNYIGVIEDAMDVWGNKYGISESDAAFLVAAAEAKDKKK